MSFEIRIQFTLTRWNNFLKEFCFRICAKAFQDFESTIDIYLELPPKIDISFLEILFEYNFKLLKAQEELTVNIFKLKKKNTIYRIT